MRRPYDSPKIVGVLNPIQHHQELCTLGHVAELLELMHCAKCHYALMRNALTESVKQIFWLKPHRYRLIVA